MPPTPYNLGMYGDLVVTLSTPPPPSLTATRAICMPVARARVRSAGRRWWSRRIAPSFALGGTRFTRSHLSFLLHARQIAMLLSMPSARLKLVKVEAPLASSSSSPFGKNSLRATVFSSNSVIECSVNKNSCRGSSNSHTSMPAHGQIELPPKRHHGQILLPPQLHHFSRKSTWLCHYRQWLKSSKAIWLQRLQRQHSILQFFAADRGHALAKPRKAAPAKPTSKLKNTTLEAYGARAGTFKVSRCCAATDAKQKQTLLLKQKMRDGDAKSDICELQVAH